MRPHTHADIEINYLTKGRLRYFHGGRFYEIRAGCLAVFWAGIPHHLAGPSSEFEGIWITFPVTWFLRWQLPDKFQDALLAGEMAIDEVDGSYNSKTDEGRLEGWLSASESRDKQGWGFRIVSLELEARLLRMGMRYHSAAKPRRRRSGNPDHFVRMTEFLARNYTRPILVDDVAEAVELHPKYCLALFKKTCGITLWDYVVRLRIAHAERMLLTSDQNALDIALDTGFASLSAFYLAFKKQTGTTPARFRKAQLEVD